MRRSHASSCLLLLVLLAIPAAAQQLSAPAVAVAVPQSLDALLAGRARSPFSGSIAAPQPQPGVLDLGVQDAIDRGLRYNLGIVLSSQESAAARAERLRQLSELLPKLEGSLQEGAYKTNLEALGLDFSVAGMSAPKAVQFSNSDLRVSMTENLFDWSAVQKTRAAGASAQAASHSYQSARETVTLAVAAAYLIVTSAESQIEASTAELKTAEALYRLAEDREAAGVTPQIDTLRARVEMQARRQALIQAKNNLAKQRISLLRAIGLPASQQIRLTTRVPYRPMPPVDKDAALELALAVRPDYLAAEQLVKAAELKLKAARAQRLPTVGISGDYGALGTRPNNTISTWSVSAGLRVPIFQGGRIEADIRQAQVEVSRRMAQRDDLRGRIEQELTDALLDVSAAADQVEVAASTLDYTRIMLTQAQDRFAAGVTNNIEVVQAQEAMVGAQEQYIASLFAHNIAKVLFARARGTAEESVHQALEEMSQAQPTEAKPDIPVPGDSEKPPAQRK